MQKSLFYSLGWDDGIYNQQKLTQADHLLPLQEDETSLPSPPPEQPPSEQPKQQTTETEPNSSTSFYQQLNIKRQESVVCNCNNSSTNNKSSSSLENNNSSSGKSVCACAERSINNMVQQSKERHMSVDSARDSGIGENSNFTDVEEHRISVEDESSSMHDLRGFWQPKVKRSLVDRLPHDSFYLVPPSRYIFPGAEVFYDPDDEKLSYEDSSSDSLESESEFETVEATF